MKKRVKVGRYNSILSVVFPVIAKVPATGMAMPKLALALATLGFWCNFSLLLKEEGMKVMDRFISLLFCRRHIHIMDY